MEGSIVVLLSMFVGFRFAIGHSGKTGIVPDDDRPIIGWVGKFLGIDPIPSDIVEAPLAAAALAMFAGFHR